MVKSRVTSLTVPFYKNPSGVPKQQQQQQQQQGVCHTVALPFTLKKYLKEKKKNYGNSNISPCKNIIFKNSSKTNQNPSRHFNSITDLKFQHKPKSHLSKILR
jgi:hypothetical protein